MGPQIIPIEDSKNIVPMKARVKLMETWWKWKKRHVIPMVMREQDFGMWIIQNDEADLYYNNEGPVYTSLLPANNEGMTFSSRYAPTGSQRIPRFLIFYDNGCLSSTSNLKTMPILWRLSQKRTQRKRQIITTPDISVKIAANQPVT